MKGRDVLKLGGLVCGLVLLLCLVVAGDCWAGECCKACRGTGTVPCAECYGVGFTATAQAVEDLVDEIKYTIPAKIKKSRNYDKTEHLEKELAIKKKLLKTMRAALKLQKRKRAEEKKARLPKALDRVKAAKKELAEAKKELAAAKATTEQEP